MSTPAVTLEQLLGELRQLAMDVAPIADHLAAIDAQLADLPQSEEVAAIRGDVDELRAAVAELKAFQEGPPPLHARLKALEEDVAAYKVSTEAREDVIAEAAGIAGDEPHRRVSRQEASMLDRGVEQRQEKVNRSVKDDLLKLFGITGGLQSANVRLYGILVLIGSGIGSILLSYFGLFK